MKKQIIFLMVLSLIFFILSCNLGMEPPPKVGINDDEGTCTLYAAGGIWNNDYTIAYDGISWFPGEAGLAGWKMNMGSSDAGGAPGTTSTKAWEWRLDEDDSLGQGAAISLLKHLPAGGYSKLSFWARVTAGGKNSSRVIVEVFVDRQGSQVGSNANILGQSSVTVNIEADNDWHHYEVPFRTRQDSLISVSRPDGGEIFIPNPNDYYWVMPGDKIVQWTIQVPGESGRIYVDNIQLVF